MVHDNRSHQVSLSHHITNSHQLLTLSFFSFLSIYMSTSTFLSLTVTYSSTSLLSTYFHSHPTHSHPIYSFLPLTSIFTPVYLYSPLYIYTTLQHQVQTLISSTIQASIISSTQALPLCLQCHIGISFYSHHHSDTHISLYFNYITCHTSSTLNTQTACHLIL